MILFLIFVSTVTVSLSASIWPQPLSSKYGASQAAIDPSLFVIQASSESSTPLLLQAIERYQKVLFPIAGSAAKNVTRTITQLKVVVEDSTNKLPPLDLTADESYKITVDGDAEIATLAAPTVWGALRGLESFLQLVDFAPSTQTYSIQFPTIIDDRPRFAWRGLLIDSARHFLSKETIFRTLETMAFNKFNVLHWHLVDAESFPLEVESLPQITKGAFHPLAVYHPNTVKEVVEYGYNLGIRVIPEVDTPGHTYSWRFANPDVSIIAQCPSAYVANVNNFPLDPSKEATFDVVKEVWKQVASAFTDDFVHIGGDEVNYACWTNDTTVAAWMAVNGYKTGPDVFQYFMNRMIELIPATINKRMVIWEDVFNADLVLPKDVVVEIWSGADTLGKVLGAGFQAINSYGWYLDKQTPYEGAPAHYEMMDNWKDFYTYEPLKNMAGGLDTSLLVGGEGCMWGEQVDDTSLEERLWPRASAIAERLWSQREVADVDAAKPRLMSFRCSMARRGVRAGPVGPDYCPLSM